MRLSEALSESAGLREKEKELLLNQYGKERKSKAVFSYYCYSLVRLAPTSFTRGRF